MSGVAAQTIEAGERRRLSPAWTRALQIGGPLVYAIATVALVTVDGVPLSRDVVFGWIIVGLLAASLADLRGWARGVIFDWLPFFALLVGYDLLRGLVGSNPLFAPHVMPQIRFDEIVFGSVPTVDLQAALLTPGTVHFYDVAAWAVYISHFFTVFVIAGVLWRVARPRFLEFRAMVLTLTAAAFATYALFPAVPPWMASDAGTIGPVDRVVGHVWDYLGAGAMASVWDAGSAFSNQVAALPSLHAAYPFLILCFFWSSGMWARIVCSAYVLAMGFSLVYGGEHYVFDVLLGWVYAITVYLLVSWIRAALARRKRGDGATPVAAAASSESAPVR